MIRLTFLCESKEHDTADLTHGLITLRLLDEPDSTIVLSSLEPDAFSQFDAGKQYYVDFIEAI